MSKSKPQAPRKTILFLGTTNRGRGRAAELSFNLMAAKLGLPWVAVSRGLAVDAAAGKPLDPAVLKHFQPLAASPADLTRAPMQATTADLEAAASIIALNKPEHEPLLKDRFPDHAARVEFWTIGDVPASMAAIEAEVMALIARLLGGRKGDDAPARGADATPPAAPPKKAVTVKVGRETAGRRGKGVTTVWDVPLNEAGLLELAAKLKSLCGTGGTVKDRKIEIQGDQRDRITAELEKLGYKVKRAGG